MHIRGVHIIFFIPGGGRQNDIGEQAGTGHAEIERHQQVELAFDGRGLPLHLFGLHVIAGAQLIALNTAVGAQQIFEHILVALAGRAQQVGAPDKQITRMIFAVIRLFAGEADLAGLQRPGGVVGGSQSGRGGLRFDGQRVDAQLRRGGQPAHALGANVKVDQMAAELAGIGQRRQQLPGGQLFIAPLAGVIVKKGGAVHLARRTIPVKGERQRQPAGLRTQLLLADIVRPAAAALADAAAEHQHIDHPPVVHIHVVPVVDAGAEDNHRPSVGFMRGIGKFTGDLLDVLARDAGNLFGPRRGIGFHLTEVLRGVGIV